MSRPATKIFALIDCNNFFVSCERLFRPDLVDKPVVVLSSNDGCVVARSNEVKALGIPMGAPAFKYRQLFDHYGIVHFSANFELYGDISRRISRLLTTMAPVSEMYSVDESFLDLQALPLSDYTSWGRNVRARLLKEVGIPVAIGIASSKTLAKLGAERAKKDGVEEGVVSLVYLTSRQRASYLRRTRIEDVWGVGRRLSPKLHIESIHTALDLSKLRPQRARQLMGLPGQQLVSELNGHSCFSFSPLHALHQTITRSRTFGEDTSSLAVIEAAVASLASQAARSLRGEQQLAGRAMLLLSTSRYKPGYRSWYESVDIGEPTCDSGQIISSVVRQLYGLYRNGYAYHRAGVTLLDLFPANYRQTDLFDRQRLTRTNTVLARMHALDTINSRFGSRHLYYAAEDLASSWKPKHTSRSPRYTSCWSELPEAFLSRPSS